MVTSIFNLNFTLGILYANILGVLTSWFVSSLAMSLLYGLIQCVLFTLPPSPYEIARAEQTKESLSEKIEESLKNWRKKTFVTEEAKDIIKAVEEEKIKTR